MLPSLISFLLRIDEREAGKLLREEHPDFPQKAIRIDYHRSRSDAKKSLAKHMKMNAKQCDYFLPAAGGEAHRLIEVFDLEEEKNNLTREGIVLKKGEQAPMDDASYVKFLQRELWEKAKTGLLLLHGLGKRFHIRHFPDDKGCTWRGKKIIFCVVDVGKRTAMSAILHELIRRGIRNHFGNLFLADVWIGHPENFRWE